MMAREGAWIGLGEWGERHERFLFYNVGRWSMELNGERIRFLLAEARRYGGVSGLGDWGRPRIKGLDTLSAESGSI